jgi:MazG C-terminal domain
MKWFDDYGLSAAESDALLGRSNYLELLAAGLLGECGSINAEVKKMAREEKAYPYYRQRLVEEIGDFLWYFSRLGTARLGNLGKAVSDGKRSGSINADQVGLALDLAQASSELARLALDGGDSEFAMCADQVWKSLGQVCAVFSVRPKDAAVQNLRKIESRWSKRRKYSRLFDEGVAPEEQLPRRFSVTFIERKRGERTEVLQRYRDINIGDRLTDNIGDPDGYRYHDAFHMAYAAILGWSPVIRSLLRCKRKSDLKIDENEDGARAIIIEESIAAVVFSRAKNMRFFQGAREVDFDLLKQIREFTSGYEVDDIPMWQWERAILEGYRVFRELRNHKGGVVSWNLGKRSIQWSAGGSN